MSTFPSRRGFFARPFSMSRPSAIITMGLLLLCVFCRWCRGQSIAVEGLGCDYRLLSFGYTSFNILLLSGLKV